MLQLMRIALVEGLLEDGKTPTFRRVCFFHCIAVSIPTIGYGRIAHEQVSIDYAAGAVHLASVVHPAMFGPTVFRYACDAVIVFYDHYRIVQIGRASCRDRV